MMTFTNLFLTLRLPTLHNLEFLIQIGIVLALAYTLGTVFYNIYFHPLSSFPGPKLYGATRLPYFKAVFTGNISFKILELHEQYGPIVRVAPNELSFVDSRAWKDIYSHRPGHPLMQKDPLFYEHPFCTTKSIIDADDESHARQRRLISNAFSEKALVEQEPYMQHYINMLMDRLRENSNNGETPQNMVSWFNWTTFDILGDLAFGESFGCLENAEYHDWVKMIFDSIKVMIYVQATNHYPIIRRALRKFLPKTLMEKKIIHEKFASDKTAKRLALKTDRKDFMSYILRHNKDKGMSDAEIEVNTRLFIEAGSETAATALCGITYNLLRNPIAMKKLAEEVRGAFQSEDDIKMSTVNSLKYLRAVMNESLRIYPAVPNGLPRLVPDQGDTVAGVWIPGGACVCVNQWAVCHSSVSFRRPECFAPERFLNDPQYADDKKEALQPFGVGPRNCLGQNLAGSEMRLILARLLWNFDLELADDSQNWSDQKIYFLWQKGPLNVKLRPRTN